MDEMTLLRQVRHEVGGAAAAVDAADSADRLAPARAKLLARAGGRPQTRRAPLVLAAAVAVALILGVGLVVSNPLASSPASATELLHRAAHQAAQAPAPGAGQYLAVRTRENSLGYVEDGREVVGAYRVTTVSTTYVPHDRDDVWIRRYWTERPTVFYGGASVRAAAERDYAVDAHADDPGLERARGGSFGNGELGGGSVGISTSEISTLPRDPRALRRRLEASGGKGDTPGVAAIQAASTLLRSGLVPADLGKALFDALALIPDVAISHGTVAMDGRTGTAVGVTEGNTTWSVVIDPDSGDYLGDLSRQADAEGAVPAGTVTDQTAVRTYLADSPQSR